MIRITSVEHGSETIISIAGTLEAEHLSDVQKHITEARSTVNLDLSDLQTADDEAFRWLDRYLERDGRVTGASPYIKWKLEQEPKHTVG